MSELAPVAELVLDEKLYPRAAVSDAHVRDIARAMDGGHMLPPVIVWRKNNKIADGAHRWSAAVLRKVEFIAVEYRDYESDEAFFRDAVLLNSNQGLNFSPYDRLKVIELGEQFGLRVLDLADLLHTSESYIKTLAPRYATVTEADKDGKIQRVQHVPLKGSVRHLKGQDITPAQEEAIRGSAPGTSYLLLTRQLISALENDLLPPSEQHPVLWEELRRLGLLIPE